MKKKLKGKRKLKWYAVKNLYESVITGEPTKSKVDENYTDRFKIYEESIMLVKAKSFNKAYKLAEKKAKKAEFNYYNLYDEFVEYKYVDSLHCFWLFDDIIKSGTEVYSRLIHVPKGVNAEEVKKAYFPESLPKDDNDPDYYYRCRIRD